MFGYHNFCLPLCIDNEKGIVELGSIKFAKETVRKIGFENQHCAIFVSILYFTAKEV